MSKTIILKDDRCIDHLTSPGHPESPQRLKSIYSMLNQNDMKGRFEEVLPRMATKEEISLNHDQKYIDMIENTAGRSFTSLDGDTNTSAGSWEAALLAVGAVLDGVDMIMEQKADNGFALVRPPGHHAEASRAMGFCLFNNIAVGAHYLLKKHGVKKVFIIDWDIHHGNGTQNSFYSNPDVFYFSTHQYPYYPGTGAEDEKGTGEGAGYTLNVPLSGGQGDDDYLNIFEEVLGPAIHKFSPEFILVSAGYDTYFRDPLGTMKVTENGFYRMTEFLKKISIDECNGRLFLGLEGGYHIEGITESVKQTILALSTA